MTDEPSDDGAVIHRSLCLHDIHILAKVLTSVSERLVNMQLGELLGFLKAYLIKRHLLYYNDT